MERGWGVRVLVRQAGQVAELPEGATGTIGDLGDPESLRTAVTGVDVVINLAAAFHGVPDGLAWAVNHDGAAALGRAARDAGVSRFVQASTNVVYGLGRGRPHHEDDHPEPGGPLWGAYAESAWQGDQALLGLDGLDVRIGRLAFVYGGGTERLALASRWLTQWPAHKRLQLVHRADAARAFWLLASAVSVRHSVFHIADDAPVAAVELLEELNLTAPEGMVDRTDDDPWHQIASNRRISDELGWRPYYPSLRSASVSGAV